MPRFKLTRVYTPNNPLQQRETHYQEFSVIEIDTHTTIKDCTGFFEAQMRQVRQQVKLDAPFPVEFTITDRGFNYWLRIERLPDVTETEATEANVVKWAEAQVALTPTVKESKWDDLKKKTVEVTVPNTVEKELTNLLLSNDVQMLENDDESDLRDTLLHIYTVGTKGYENMTRKELLDQISNEILDPSDAKFLEDLEAFSPKDDESE